MATDLASGADEIRTTAWEPNGTTVSSERVPVAAKPLLDVRLKIRNLGRSEPSVCSHEHTDEPFRPSGHLGLRVSRNRAYRSFATPRSVEPRDRPARPRKGRLRPLGATRRGRRAAA